MQSVIIVSLYEQSSDCANVGLGALWELESRKNPGTDMTQTRSECLAQFLSISNKLYSQTSQPCKALLFVPNGTYNREFNTANIS